MLPDTPLSVTLRAVVGLTQQLAVAFVGGTTFRPRSDVVGIHRRQRPNFSLLRVMSDGAVGTVRDPFGLSLVGLLLVNVRNYTDWTDVDAMRGALNLGEESGTQNGT